MSGRFKDKKLFILDMDGTIYLDETPLPGAREFIKAAKSRGTRIIYFTNNASKSIAMYYEKLNRLGFDVSDGDVISSADVTIDYIKRCHKNQSVYLVGTPALEKSFSDSAVRLSDGTEADIVVVSFDTTVTYEKLKNACNLINNGALFYSTHPDLTCPVKDGFIPDSGAICALITAATGKSPRYFGKPYYETAQYLVSHAGVDFASAAVVGDRLYTDIALGKNHGITSV
ncbi:MAG: HAD-IIA family hydrolase, partial [Eubacteriales bacterium]|nr:HAD-IIA family hydrolase [Eubacteriales bacterium]